MAENGQGLEARRRRAIFRAAHRGTREMDWILGRFAEAEVEAMPEDELAAFEEFLALPDPDIEQWVVYGAAQRPEGALGAFVARLRRFHALGD
jgi:antitoxin CptB